MKSEEKFDQLYSKILNENLQSMEHARNRAKSETMKNVIISIILIIIGIIFFYASYKFTYPYIELAEGLMFLYIPIVVFVYYKTSSNSKNFEYEKEFKSKVINSLLHSFDENIKFIQSFSMDSRNYKEAEFEKFDNYRAEDFMRGTLKNGCNFEMCEALTEREYKDTDGHTQHSTLFCGIFSKIETPKPFNASLYLRKDRKDKNILYRAFVGKLPFDDLKVDLDSKEFEKYFDVYSTDKIIAMQLLTSDIMQLLVNFQEEMDMEYELTIKNNCIYIRFMSGKMFETAIVTKFSLDKKMLYKYYKMLDFSFTLTNKLINLIKDTEYSLDQN